MGFANGEQMVIYGAETQANRLRGAKMILRDDIPIGASYDSRGRMQTYKTITGWLEYTHDAKGRVLTYKNSTGDWREFTYDAKGLELTYKKEGFSGVRIAESRFTLYHDAERDLFLAGCRGPLTRAKALKHWDRGDERAKLFTKAIQLGG